MTQHQISSITIPAGTTIFKARTNSGQPGFGIATVVQLQDGRKFPSFETLRRKRDLLPWVSDRDAAAKQGRLKALLDEHGAFFGTQTTYRIGA